MDEEQLALLEARYAKWSPNWRAFLPESVALLAAVRSLKVQNGRLLAAVDAAVPVAFAPRPTEDQMRTLQDALDRLPFLVSTDEGR